MEKFKEKKRWAIYMSFAGYLMLFALCGCQTLNDADSSVSLLKDGVVSDDHDRDNAVALFYEIGGEDAFVDMAQYLYRWYLDEDDFKDRNPLYRGKLWIRKLDRVLDKGDKSQFIEMVFPAIGVMVTLKKSDYEIEELQLKVKSDGYKIVNVCRATCAMIARPEDYASLDMDIDALYQRLFETRLETEYPDKVLFDYMRACAAEQCGDYKDKRGSGDQFVWLAPISKMSNEIWVYWENGKMLFHFVADVDMHNPEIWAHDSILVSHYDIITQTIVSYEEAPGKDGFMTRDQVGRILFNCMAFGKKVKIDE
jgi:hypothetical protein